MDASNPVSSGDKVTFAELKEDSLLLKRQNFEELRKLVATSPRTPAPFIGNHDYVYDERSVKALIEPIAVEKGVPDCSFLVKAEKVRVCSLHTMGENQEEGYVSLKQTYKVARRDKKLVEVCLRSGAQVSDIKRYIYTTGDKEGFSSRLKLWATRRVPNPKEAMSKYNIKMEDVRKMLPVRDGLPNWNGKTEDFISAIRVNKSSGAGPPFYRVKRSCLDDCFDAIQKMLDEASQDQLTDFLKKNEEFLISQCKNKTDRYDPEKLKDKTRPYYAFSFPVQFLCSALNQPFTDNMYQFHESGVNACGFSYANGGAQKLLDWMLATKEGEVKYCVYGDDTRLVMRRSGVLYSNSPDFKCMDGSVHKVQADAYVDYVLDCFEREHGKSNFWRLVGEIWKKQLVGAKFFVNGSQPFANQSGLLTGCVGTTGVDTFTSCLAWTTLLEARHHGIDLESVQQVKDFLRVEFGLELKGETYEWSVVQEELVEGDFPTDQSFLGVQLKMVMGGNRLEAVPYKNESDLVALISNARIPAELSDLKRTTARSRYFFDCGRGYMVTAAFHHEVPWNICSRMIEDAPTEVICMRVQTGKKNDGEYGGEGPELQTLVGEDFSWPSSDGWPSVDFCLDVYLSKDNKRGGVWYDCVPDLRKKLDEIKRYRSMDNADRVPPVVAKPSKGNWGDEAEAERSLGLANERMNRKRDPTIGADGHLREMLREDMPLMKPTRMPKDFVKYKSEAQSIPKEDRIRNAILPEVEMFHRDYVPLVTGLAPGKCAEVLIQLGWRPSPESSFWERGPIVEVNESHWTKAELDRLTEVQPRGKGEVRKKKEAEKSDLVSGTVWSLVPDDVVLSPKGADVVSKVTYSFNIAGYILDKTSRVLQNSPNPWVAVTLAYRGTGVVLGVGYGSNKKAAEKSVFEDMLEKLQAREDKPTDDVHHKEKPLEIKNNNNEDKESRKDVDGNGGANEQLHLDAEEKEEKEETVGEKREES